MMKLSVFTTATEPYARQDPFGEAIRCYGDLADEVVVEGKDWPQEFLWPYIGETFQRAYEKCTGDWVIHADLDYIFHENDFHRMRTLMENNPDTPAFSFWKYQFLLVDRYNIKTKPVIAVNKKHFGDQIRFDGGNDLTQPTFNGKEMTDDWIPSARLPFYNYDFCFKTEKTIRHDFPRFSRAWFNHFGNEEFGGVDEESSFASFKNMMTGRMINRAWRKIRIDEHPKYIQKRILAMTPDQFGHSMFGWVGETATYFSEEEVAARALA